MKVAEVLGPRPARPGRSTRPDRLPGGRPAWLGPALAVAVVAVVLLGVALRFWTQSELWLDEALTVDIARLPLHSIPEALRHDGSPPLYYVLLHFWMIPFGQSDLAVRSLSGVFGVLALPVSYFVGRRVGGRPVGFAMLLLLATNPFAVRYSTENRMYMMIALLTGVGFLAVTSALRRPTVWRLAGVTAVGGLLLYSHYWCIYLLAATVVLLAAHAWRAEGEQRRAALLTGAATVASFVLLAPWASIFAYQLHHTGTPWAGRPSFNAMVNAVSDFSGGASSGGRALGLIFFGLAALGLFGVAMDRWRVELDFHTRPAGRNVAWITFGTLFVAIVGGIVGDSAFQPRYTAVVLIMFLALVGLGLVTFADPRLRTGVLSVAVALGLLNSFSNVTTNRTQAFKVASALATYGQPGDLVVYCPDQLGPAVNRLLPPGRYDQTTFPRGTGPAIVNWVDYAQVARATAPTTFARQAVARAAGHNLWLVWSPSYLAIGSQCQKLEAALAADRPHSKALFLQGPYFENESLVRFWAH
ncbi:MAG TPA: glycosyltransferase family 39 protein [Acidimicrobiales bacterium]|nr:glycosyltransferase family 39 protein [Acidimicrobiales bacterium]